MLKRRPPCVFEKIDQKWSISSHILSQNYYIFKMRGGWPRGWVVKLMRSAAGGPVFRRFESWARTWHCSSNHAEAASHMPQLEWPTTKNIQLCTRGLWGEKGKNKIFKKEKDFSHHLLSKFWSLSFSFQTFFPQQDCLEYQQLCPFLSSSWAPGFARGHK